MKIEIVEMLSEESTIERLRRVRLRGHGSPEIYRDADISFVTIDEPEILAPAQRYIMRDTVKKIIEIRAAVAQQYRINLFNLYGAVFLKIDGETVPFLPPILEATIGGTPLICDGMHRVASSIFLDRSIRCIFISGVPAEFPYYALPNPNGWQDVSQLSYLPEGFLKKTYVDPTNYKSLFRDFNAVFPGVQKDRAKSNPAGVNP